MEDLWRGEVKLLRKSTKAILVVYEGDEQWIPKSQIHDDSGIYGQTAIGNTGELVIPAWLAAKKSWD
jgi:hypothetical protein